MSCYLVNFCFRMTTYLLFVNTESKTTDLNMYVVFYTNSIYIDMDKEKVWKEE